MIKKSAFTLVEMLVVVGILLLTFTFGLINFFNYRQRLELENAVAQVQSALQQAQSYARLGNRGAPKTTCNPTDAVEVKLNYWQVSLDNNSEGRGEIILNPVCVLDITARPEVEVPGETTTFLLPKGFSFTGSYSLKFISVFGNVKIETPAPTNSQVKIIVKDTENGYRFFLNEGGGLSSGCYCTNNSCSEEDYC